MKKLLLLFLILCAGQTYCQLSKLDSLRSRLSKNLHDTDKVNTLCKLGSALYISNPDSTIILAEQAVALAHKINFRKGEANAYGTAGVGHWVKADYPNALKNYFAALKIDEALNNRTGIAARLGNIGNVYLKQADYPKALDYYFRALKMSEELGDKNRIAIWLGNIGIVYDEQADYPKALDYDFRALKMSEELGDKRGISRNLDRIAIVYEAQKEFSKAEANYFESLKIAKEIGDKNHIAILLGNIGSLYTTIGKFKEAEEYLKHSLALCDSIGTLDGTRDFELSLSQLYDTLATSPLTPLQRRGELYKLAFAHYKKYITARDTINSEENQKKQVRTEMNYEFEKKEAAAQAEQEKKDAVAVAESRKQQIIIWSVLSGLLLVVVFAGFIFRSLRITKKQKHIIEIQKDEVTKQKVLVEKQREGIAHKNKDLTDSIRYAERIQRAILTSEQYLNDMFLPQGQPASHFILYKPKDIVAGDFYWAYKTPHGKSIWVTADCTGHGVPGAFMSMIGNSLLNEIIVEKGIEEPNEILNHLRAGVINAVGQSGEAAQIKDGMDCALCSLDKANNKISFSGANNSLWILRKFEDNNNNEQLIELKADRQPIGSSLVMEPFTKREIQLQKGDTLYTFTDGYCDQFGGAQGKKFGKKSFRELLISIQEKSMSEQKQILNKAIDEWIGELDQLDDICVFGVIV